MIGQRLKQARLGAGLSMEELVGKMGHSLTRQAISKYETGKSSPSPEILVRLAETLGVKTSYFMEEPKVQIKFIAYRKHSRLPKNEMNRLQVEVTNHVENYCELASIFSERLNDKIEKNVVGIPKPKNVGRIEEAEKIAREIRERWKIGMDPIENLVETLEDHAAIVLALNDHNKFDGISARANFLHDNEKIMPVIVTNSDVPGDRQRFNLAHELGHLIIQPIGTKQDEEIAHRFAAAFLVPDIIAFKELGHSRSRIEFDELLLLKHKYGISMQAWLRRAKDLGIISFSWYKNASVIFRKRGWHRREPGKQLPPEKPTKFQQFVLRAFAENIISRERAEELCPGAVSLDTNDQEEINAKVIAIMSLEERNRILEAAADRATQDYETDKELTVFTDLDGAINDL